MLGKLQDYLRIEDYRNRQCVQLTRQLYKLGVQMEGEIGIWFIASSLLVTTYLGISLDCYSFCCQRSLSVGYSTWQRWQI